MPKGFLPNSDGALQAWSLHFSTLINSTPAAYGISPAQAAAFATLQSDFARALEACEPNVRNKISVATKNAARTVMKQSASQLARQIYGNANVTVEQKIELGLSVRSAPTPAPVPQDPPGIGVVSMRGNSVTFKLFDRSVARRGKPVDVDGACMFSFVGDVAPTELSQWKFEGVTSKTNVEIVFPSSVAPGSRVWFSAYWFNTRKQPGPAAPPIMTNVAGGMVNLAA